jgi:hypothetical protein
LSRRRTSASLARDPSRAFLRAGLGALSLSGRLRLRLRAEAAASAMRDRTAVTLVWLHGGCSHLDTYDPKPDAPAE